MRISVSIGISPYTQETQGPDEMLAQADIALYRAKDEGRNQYCFHNDTIDREAHKRVAVANDLRRALEGDELELYFQPQVELATGLIVGMEALIRCRHPTLGLLQPADFLPMVELTPLIVTFGQWVFDHACEQMDAWRTAGITLPILAVNMSLKQLQAGERLVEFDHSDFDEMGAFGQGPGARCDGIDACTAHHAKERCARPSAKTRHENRHRRLRNSIFLAGLSEVFPREPREDTQIAD